MTLIDVLIEEVADVHTPDVTEKAFNSEGLLVLDYRKEVQLEKLDHQFYPLELIGFELDWLPSLNDIFAHRAIAALSLMLLILCKEALSDLLLLGGINIKALINDAFLSATHF